MQKYFFRSKKPPFGGFHELSYAINNDRFTMCMDKILIF